MRHRALKKVYGVVIYYLSISILNRFCKFTMHSSSMRFIPLKCITHEVHKLIITSNTKAFFSVSHRQYACSC